MASNCYIKVKEWAKKNNVEVPDRVLRNIDRRLNNLIESSGAYSPAEFAAIVTEESIEHAQQFALRTRVNKKNALVKRRTVSEKLIKESGDPQDRFTSFKRWVDGGSAKIGFESNQSPKAMIEGYLGSYFEIIRNDISDADWDMANDPSIAKELVGDKIREDYAIENGLPVGQTGNDVAVRLAMASKKQSLQVFKDKKSVNAHMTMMEDHLGKQVWKRERVTDVPEEEFVSDMMKHAGNRSYMDQDIDGKIDIFAQSYRDIEAGVRRSAQPINPEPGTSRVWSMAASRKVIANNVESRVFLAQKYGYETVGEEMTSLAKSASREVGSMKKFTHDGPTFLKELARDTFPGNPELAKEAAKWAVDQYEMISEVDTPSNNIGKVASILLTSESVTMLGTGSISMWGDTAAAAALLNSVNGDGLMSNVSDLVPRWVQTMTDSDIRKDIFKTLGLLSRHASGNHMEHLGFHQSEASWADTKQMVKDGKYIDAAHHGVAKIGQLYGHINLLNATTDTAKSLSAMGLAEGITRAAGFAFDELSPELHGNLHRQGLDTPAQWKYIQQNIGDYIDPFDKTPGKLVTPRSLRNGSDASAIELLFSQGVVKPSPFEIAGAKSDTAMRMATMLNDFADRGSSTPGTYEHNLLKGNQSINTWWGATRAFITQFKGSALTAVNTARRVYYSGAAGNKGDMAGLMKYGAFGFAIGGVITMAKGIVVGKEPESPMSFGFAAEAMARSGMGDIYTSGLLRSLQTENPMLGKSQFLADLAGPVLGDIAQVVGLGAGAVGAAHAKISGGRAPDPLKPAGKFLINKIPSTVWSKGIQNYLFLDSLKESIDHGAATRNVRKLNEDEALIGEGKRDYFIGGPQNRLRTFE